jgi:hypothetical protein
MLQRIINFNEEKEIERRFLIVNQPKYKSDTDMKYRYERYNTLLVPKKSI